MKKGEVEQVLAKVRANEQLSPQENKIYLDFQRAMNVYFNGWDLKHPIKEF